MRLKLLTGHFRLGHLLYLLTDKYYFSRDRYFNANQAKLRLRNAFNEIKKFLQQKHSDSINDYIFKIIILMY